MPEENIIVRDEILNRLRRIEGQARGLQTMVSEGRNCRDILQQMNAARSALQAAAMLLLEQYASDCILDIETKSEPERRLVIQDLITVIGRAPIG